MEGDGLAVGVRVEVRGKGDWRQGTVTGRRQNGQWEVRVDGWDKAYTWPEIRLVGQGEPTPPPVAASLAPRALSATPIAASGSSARAAAGNTGGDGAGSDDDDLFAPGVSRPFGGGGSALTAAARGRGATGRGTSRFGGRSEPYPRLSLRPDAMASTRSSGATGAPNERPKSASLKLASESWNAGQTREAIVADSADGILASPNFSTHAVAPSQSALQMSAPTQAHVSADMFANASLPWSPSNRMVHADMPEAFTAEATGQIVSQQLPLDVPASMTVQVPAGMAHPWEGGLAGHMPFASVPGGGFLPMVSSTAPGTDLGCRQIPDPFAFSMPQGCPPDVVPEQNERGSPPDISESTLGVPRPLPFVPRGRCQPGGKYLSVLLVAEKPTIAQAFAAALAPEGRYKKDQERGRLPSFTFNAPWVGVGGAGPSCCSLETMCRYRVTSTVGHIYNLDFPVKERNWSGDPETLFDSKPELVDAKDDARVPQHLADEASCCHIVILCLDCDREGEAIGYEVLGSVLPNLAVHPAIRVSPSAPASGAPLQGYDFGEDERVWRARFSSLAPGDLKLAVRELQKPNALEARAVDARAEIDLKVGVALTRLITSNLREEVGALAPQRKAESRHGALISYGPCQTPTLGFCVDRWDELQRFSRETAFTVDLTVRTPGGGMAVLSWVPPQELLAESRPGGFFRESGTQRKDILEEFVARISAGDAAACVCTSKTAQDCAVERPEALNTVGLLKAASRELRMDPQRAMSVAEKLYLSGLLTYPRTETTHYPGSLNLTQIVEEHSKHEQWGAWCRQLLQGLKVAPPPGRDLGDHPPITPVKCASEAEVQQAAGRGDPVNLYALVTKRLLASVSPDVRYRHHEAYFELGGFRFALRGNEITDWGFMRICPGAVHAAPNATVLHRGNLLKDERLQLAQEALPGLQLEVASIALREVSSKPPQLLTEAELLETMEVNRIGTDASMPQHVSNVVARGYVEVVDEENRRLRPTVLGLALVRGLRVVDAELTQAAVRSRIEQDVAKVASGERRCEEVVTEAVNVFREKYRAVRSGIPELLRELRELRAQAEQHWEAQVAMADAMIAEARSDTDAVVESPATAGAAGSGAEHEPRNNCVEEDGKRRRLEDDKGDASASCAADLSSAPVVVEVAEIVPESPAGASEETLRAESAALRQQLRYALLKAESASLRAENAEIRLAELQKKQATMEAKLAMFAPPPVANNTERRNAGGGKGGSGWNGAAGKGSACGGAGKGAQVPLTGAGIPPPSGDGSSGGIGGRAGIGLRAPKRPYAAGSTGQPGEDEICWSFKRGHCKRGVLCKYSHASASGRS